VGLAAGLNSVLDGLERGEMKRGSFCRLGLGNARTRFFILGGGCSCPPVASSLSHVVSFCFSSPDCDGTSSSVWSKTLPHTGNGFGVCVHLAALEPQTGEYWRDGKGLAIG